MIKYYIGFGILTLGVFAAVLYGITVLQTHPYISPTQQAQSTSRDARRVSDVHQIQTALELFYNDCGNYPAALVTANALNCPIGTSLGTYINPLPINPSPGGMAYTYVSVSPNDTYTLTFSLEGKGILGPGIHTASQNGIK